MARGGDRERQLTIAFAYFDQPKMLEKQLEVISSYDRDVLKRLRLVIVDDHSHNYPLLSFNQDLVPDLHVEIYRILDSFNWNQMGARNLAMHHTKGWAFLIDPDHTIPPKLIEWVLDVLLPGAREDRYYLFKRVYARAGEKMGVAPNIYVVHPWAYWKAGGMDESYRGHKGWSDITFRDAMESQHIGPKFIDRCPAFLTAWSWRDWKEREPVLIKDAAVAKLDRDIRYNEGKRNRMIDKIRRHRGGRSRGWRDYIQSLKPLQFRWKRTFP